MNIAQKLKEEGLEEGRQEGKQEAAKQMLARGMSYQVIQEVTGLTAQQIERLQQDSEDQ